MWSLCSARHVPTNVQWAKTGGYVPCEPKNRGYVPGAKSVNRQRSYLYHLEKCGEMLASMLGTIHNLRYYLRLAEMMRDALDKGTFDDFVEDFYKRRGLEVPPCPQD